MAASPIKPVQCAIYTRKSTEHGLELEFNSLDAQREACEAYIKSQASQGWRALPQHYDDPAYSGGNLDRPALQRLLKDVEAGRIDVVVVYKIDRLTRSLADFAKLVEKFDAKSISFVAVTQQFNTTSSMGRLTLNVLLSFAQFERELASERVKDKVAASRRKGKWTGGTVPLGYEARDKKLVVHEAEAKVVRTIFARYVELKSFQKLVEDLDRRKVVTKRRDTKVKKYQGGIPFTYGPLAHLLKNRIYLGEVGHKGKWFEGEHEPIIDRKTFDQVQSLLKSNQVGRYRRRSESGALLMGKLYDDRGNRMSPSYSTKNGVRYRFYVSAALLRGRRGQAGSLGRVPAAEIEEVVVNAVRSAFGPAAVDLSHDRLLENLQRALLHRDHIDIEIAPASAHDHEGPEGAKVRIPWAATSANSATVIQVRDGEPTGTPDQTLLQSVVRALAWLRGLNSDEYGSIEDLGKSQGLHPKNVRLWLRLAFLRPDLIAAILSTDHPRGANFNTIAQELSWTKQQELLSR